MSRRALALLLGVAVAAAACSMDWSLMDDAREAGVTRPIDAGVDVDFVPTDGDVDAPADAIADVLVPREDVDQRDTAPPGPCNGATCKVDEVCAYPDKACGVNGQPVECVSKSTFCGIGFVCGCDGTIYASECVAVEAGTTPTAIDNCGLIPSDTIACGSYRYCPRSSYVCVRPALGEEYCASRGGCGTQCSCLLPKFCDAGSCNGAGSLVDCTQ